MPDAALEGVRLVHLTGITMAISESGRDLVVDLARRAKAAGATVLFDPNFRPALPTPPPRRPSGTRGVPLVDWYLTGEDEAGLLWGDVEIPARVVRRVGARGAIVDGVRVPCAREVSVVDEIGAGDAFAAGFAYGVLAGWDPPECTHAGNVLAAHALEGTGDWETLPRLAEVADQRARPAVG